MKHLLSIVFFVFLIISQSCPLYGQEKQKSQSQETYQEPDIPGVLYLGIGWSILNNRPESMDNNIWGSRAFQAYYLYNFDVKGSLFTFRPGFGISTYNFKFDTNDDFPGQTNTLVKVNNDQSAVVPLESLEGFENITEVHKSLFQIVYLDIPVELVYNAKKEMERSGFYFALGVKGGLRIDSKTKISYEQEGEDRKEKRKNNFNFQTFRYSVGARTGVGKVSLFYWWTINDIFEDEQSPAGAEDTNYMTFGLTLSIL
jgi:hypothetical protein